MMKRDDCLKVLAAQLSDDQIVVAAYTTAFDWLGIRPSPFNFISSGAMGLTGPHGLGFALAWPDRRIIVLDGDGSLLMGLGSLVSIAEAAPKNLIHCVCENGTYEANGGHPIPARDRVDFAAMAKGAGYAQTHSFSELSEFQTGIGSVLQEEGPVFVDLKFEPGEKYPLDYGLMHGPKIREEFRAALKGQ
ncbi:MAG: sulfopyruvate decarboxylase subunit beta [Alphaproteobacteria bacterium]|jgi:sulfopyruvate decarboxylase subunit beta